MTYPTAKLGDVAEFIRGITFKPDDVVPVDAHDAVVCMRTKNVQTLLDCDDLLAVPSQFVRRKDQYLYEGDILVSSANSWNLVGKCCWVPALPWRAAFGGFISVLRGDANRVDRRYLYWWFASERTQALLRSFGQKTTNISNLNIERCLQLELPLPSVNEQRRIAAILDKADALRSMRREVLAQLDRLAQSIFVEMFGDPIENPKGYPVRGLIELVDPARPISYGILMPGPDVVTGVKYVRVVDMKNGGIDISGIRRTTPEISRAYKRSLLKSGDLLMSIRGHVGRMAIIPEALDGANITQDSARLAIVGASSLYVRECLRSTGFQRWMAKHTKGVAVRGINLGDVKLMPIPVPPQSAQDEFAERVHVLERLQEQSAMALAGADSLFAALRHRALEGVL